LVLADRDATFTTIVRVQAVKHRKLWADCSGNLVDDFEWESDSVLE
jgi:hypothetical protein